MTDRKLYDATPGPWRAWGGGSINVSTEHNINVAKIITPNSYAGPSCMNQVRANAALIAAAPELRDALYRIHRLTLQDNVDTAFIRDLAIAALERVRIG